MAVLANRALKVLLERLVNEATKVNRGRAASKARSVNVAWSARRVRRVNAVNGECEGRQAHLVCKVSADKLAL